MNNDRPEIDTEKLKALAKLRIVLDLPGMTDVPVRTDLTYRKSEAGELTMDVYSPPAAAGPRPALIFVTGYPDLRLMELTGLRLKDMGCYVSWAQAVALSGIVGIAYTSASPPEDAQAVLRYVRENAGVLGVDPARIGIWAASGNGPTALSLLMSADADLRCAVMCNTFMLDLDGDSAVASGSEMFGFAAPNAGKSIEEVPSAVPVFVVRSGNDEIPGLNGTIDRFVAGAIVSNRPVTLVNLPRAPHSFELHHDTEASRETIRQILSFLRSNLG